MLVRAIGFRPSRVFGLVLSGLTAFVTAGCVGAGAPDAGPLQHRPTAGAVTAVGATSGGGSTGSTGGTTAGTGAATTGGSTSGTTGSASQLPDGGCVDVDTVLPFDGCDAGVEIQWYLQSQCEQSMALPNTSVTDVLDPGVFATSDSCGFFHLCVAPGESVELEATAPSSAPALSEVFAASTNTRINGIFAVYCNALVDSLGGGVQVVNPALATVGVDVFVGPNPECPRAGWSFALSTPDGGILDAGALYVEGQLAEPGGPTSGSGFAIFLGLDPNLGTVDLSATLVAPPDGGNPCQDVGAFQPGIPLRGGFLTYVPYTLAP